MIIVKLTTDMSLQAKCHLMTNVALHVTRLPSAET